MNNLRATGLLLSLPLIIFLWQGSSCRSARSNTAEGNRAGNANQTRELTGMWGGPHIAMKITASGADIEYDCAHGRIAERIVPDRNGGFAVKGVHVPEHPGPTRQGEDNEQAAAYRGSIDGETMTLTVTLTKTKETLGTYTLTRGSEGEIVKCR